MLVDFFLERLEEFVFGAGLPGPIEPVRRAGWGNQRANDAALDHSIEVSCPRLESWSLCQRMLLLRLLILREGGQRESSRDAQDSAEEDASWNLSGCSGLSRLFGLSGISGSSNYTNQTDQMTRQTTNGGDASIRRFTGSRK